MSHVHEFTGSKEILYGDVFTDKSTCACEAVRLQFKWGNKLHTEIREP